MAVSPVFTCGGRDTQRDMQRNVMHTTGRTMGHATQWTEALESPVSQRQRLEHTNEP